jgi:hypothetical protein
VLFEHEATGVEPVARASPPAAEPRRLENPTTIVPGDRVTHLVYEVCTG